MAISRWPLAVPPLAVSVLAVALWWSPGALCDGLAGALVGWCSPQIAVVAHRVGEPFGTLVALAMTAIETSDRVDDAGGGDDARRATSPPRRS